MTPFRSLVIFMCVLSSACTSSVVRNPLPEELHRNVTVLGHADYRFWGDEPHLQVFHGAASVAELEEQYGGIMHQAHNYLVVSGGGPYGAYGAGVLKAWSELGTRPQFTVVTGVSTGALIAPFAFLGSDYDAELERFYTTLDTTQILDRRSMFALIGADSVADTSPLARLLETAVSGQMIEELAREYRKGRILSVATTNMDAARPVVWNITRIAASGHPDALALIRSILLASASIPGAFPPVYIEVETPDGQRYDEMHADGGVTGQMYFYPAGVDWAQVHEALDIQGTPTIWLIRNAYIHPHYTIVEPRLLPIAGRTIDSLIRTQGIGDFFRIWTLAKRDGLDLEVTWIPDQARSEIPFEATEVFDPRFMKALFEFGHRQTLDGNTWKDFATMMRQIDRIEISE